MISMHGQQLIANNKNKMIQKHFKLIGEQKEIRKIASQLFRFLLVILCFKQTEHEILKSPLPSSTFLLIY